MKRFLKVCGILLFIPIGIGLLGFFLFGLVWCARSPAMITYEGYAKNLSEIKISNNIRLKTSNNARKSLLKEGKRFTQEKLLEFIPDSATDIRYSVSPYEPYVAIVFSISQEDFESFVSQRMTVWKLENKSDIIRGDRVFSCENGKEQISIKSDLYYEGKPHGLPIEIIYDKKQELCYFHEGRLPVVP